MGAKVSKISCESETGTNEIHTPPAEQKKKYNFLLCDPRSPTEDISRTPIQVECSQKDSIVVIESTDTCSDNVLQKESETESLLELMPSYKRLMSVKDPRSPSSAIVRTPIQIVRTEEDTCLAATPVRRKYLETNLDEVSEPCINAKKTEQETEGASKDDYHIIQAATDVPSSDSEKCVRESPQSMKEEKEDIDDLLEKLSAAYPILEESENVNVEESKKDLAQENVDILRKKLYHIPGNFMSSCVVQDKCVRKPLSNLSNVKKPRNIFSSQNFNSVKKDINDFMSGEENTPPSRSFGKNKSLAQWDQDETIII